MSCLAEYLNKQTAFNLLIFIEKHLFTFLWLMFYYYYGYVFMFIS
jgi:hypothetical protein